MTIQQQLVHTINGMGVALNNGMGLAAGVIAVFLFAGFVALWLTR